MAPDLVDQPSAQALIRAFVELGGGGRPSEVGEVAGLPSSTRSKWLGRLRDAGWISGSKTRVELTPAGWEVATGLGRLQAIAEADSAGSELGEVLALWPTPEHRAFSRLMVSAVIARHHLGRTRPDGHPCFVAAGYTGSGKTTHARLACRVFGLDPEAHVVLLPPQTEGLIKGRRSQVEGGTWQLDPSPLTSRLLVCFDEFDKASPGLQGAALTYFHGLRVVDVDTGTSYPSRPVPMLTANVPPGDLRLLPDEYRRRSVVLHTDPLRPLLANVDAAIESMFEVPMAPLEIDNLRPAGDRLPDDARAMLRDLLQRCLTDRGWELCDVRSIELLALSRGGGQHVSPLGLAAATAADYLACSSTVDETRADWMHTLAVAAGAIDDGTAHGVGQAIADMTSSREDLEATRRASRLENAQARDELTIARGQFDETLHQLHAALDLRRLPAPDRPEAKGLRRALAAIREANSRQEDLAELQLRAAPIVTRGRTILDGVEAAKRDAAAANAQAADDAASRRRQAKAQATRRRDARREAEKHRRALADLMLYDTPTALGDRLVAAGYLTKAWVPSPPIPKEAGWKDKLLAGITSGRHELRRPDGRRILDPVKYLAELHTAYNQRVGELDGKATKAVTPRQRKRASHKERR